MGRRRRHTDGGEIALMAVTTKAMGAFLILMIFGFKYYVADMEGAREAEELTERLAETRDAMARATDRARRGEYTEEEMQAVLAALLEAEEALAAAEALVAQLKARLDQALSAIRRLEEENARLVDENLALRAENERLVEENAALADAVAALAAEVEALQGEVARLTAELAAAAQRLAEAEARLAQAEAENAALRARNAQIEAELARLLSENQALQAEIVRLQQELQALRARNTQLQAENDALNRQVADLSAEVAWLREQLSRAQLVPPLLVDYRYGNCPGAVVRLSVARQPRRDPATPEPVIPEGDAVAWSPVARGMEPDLPPGSTARYAGGEGGTGGFTTIWLDSPGEGERFALWLKWVNALPGGELTCTGAFSLFGRDARLTVGALEIEETRPTHLVAVLEHSAGALTEAMVDDTQRQWLHDYLARSPCDALACAPGAPKHRDEAMRLVVARLRDQVLNPGANPTPEEIARGNTVLTELARLVVDGEGDLATARRWSDLIGINNRGGKPGEMTAGEVGEFEAWIKAAGAPPPIAAEFARRSLDGWWLRAHALNRLHSAGIRRPDAMTSGEAREVLGDARLPRDFSEGLAEMLGSGLLDEARARRWVEVFGNAQRVRRGPRPDGRMLAEAMRAMLQAGVPGSVADLTFRMMTAGALAPEEVLALLSESGLRRD